MPSKKRVFIPHETRNHPFDVTLAVEDGREFKAHRRVLSKASPFFEKLLNSDMKETNEGLIRLEMLTEPGLRDILEFIYTGRVKIQSEDNAQELIAMADYLVLPHLKSLAGKVLAKELDASNSISTYYFAERYRCEELISISKNFILRNFTTVAKTQDFLNLSSKEVKLWLSSDDINVSAEDDVFKIILSWIDLEKSERKEYFAELFREVRLVCISLDFLRSDIATNDLVNINKGCMELVSHAMEFIKAKDHHQLSVKPRKSLETSVMVLCVQRSRNKSDITCYDPREDTWSCLRDIVPPSIDIVASCYDKIYFLSQRESKLLCYDSFSNSWTPLKYEEKRRVLNLFVRNDDEMYALVSDSQIFCDECVSLRGRGFNFPCRKKHLSYLTKYKPESNSWDDISSFDLGQRIRICIVCKDNFVYFLGGYAEDREDRYLRDADRYDLNTNKWDKIAELRLHRQNAQGAVAYGKIFIAGGTNDYSPTTCEMYKESTDVWQLIASMRVTILDYRPNLLCGMVCTDGKLYAMNHFIKYSRSFRGIECYDHNKDAWNEKTRIEKQFEIGADEVICSMRVFKGCKFLQQASRSVLDDMDCVSSSLEESTSSGKRKCAIM